MMLKIGWCPRLDVFLADSEMCGLAHRTECKNMNGRWWGIPRESALKVCEELHEKGAILVWLGGKLPPPEE